MILFIDIIGDFAYMRHKEYYKEFMELLLEAPRLGSSKANVAFQANKQAKAAAPAAVPKDPIKPNGKTDLEASHDKEMQDRLRRDAESKGVEHYGQGQYGPKGGKGKQTPTYRSEGDRLIALTNDEKDEWVKKNGEKQGTPKTPTSDNKGTQVQDILGQLNKLEIGSGSGKSQAQGVFFQDPRVQRFLRNPTELNAKIVQNFFGLTFSHGQLRRVTDEGSERVLGGNLLAADMAASIANKFAELGMPLESTPTGIRDSYSPVDLYDAMPVKVTIDSVQSDIGITINNKTYKSIRFPENFVKSVIQKITAKHPYLSSEEIDEIKEAATALIEVDKIKTNKLLQLNGQTAYLFEGEEGIKILTNTLVNKMMSDMTPHQQDVYGEALYDAFTRMGNARKESEFTSAAHQLVSIVTSCKDTIGKGKSSIVESISALHEVVFKGVAMIPAGKTTPLIDCVGLSNNTNVEADIEKMSNRVSLIFTEIESEDVDDQNGINVKFDKGAASANSLKYESSVFRTSINGKQYENVSADLSAISKNVKLGIFSDSPLEKRAAQNQSFQFFEKYKDQISAYYNIHPNASLKDMMQIMGSGTRPVCGPDGYATAGEFNSYTEDAKNQQDLMMMNAVMLASDAVYNRFVTGQAFASHLYKAKGMQKTDGVITLSRMESDLGLKGSYKRASDGTKKPAKNMVSWTTAATRKSIRFDNSEGACKAKRK